MRAAALGERPGPAWGWAQAARSGLAAWISAPGAQGLSGRPSARPAPAAPEGPWPAGLVGILASMALRAAR
jgi:hypothetical protein